MFINLFIYTYSQRIKMNEKEINEKKEIDQNTSPNVINFYDEYKEELEDSIYIYNNNLKSLNNR